MTRSASPWHNPTMTTSYCAAMGAGYATIGEYVPAASSASILTHDYLPRPVNSPVPRATIGTMGEVRDYARAGFHAVVDAYVRAGKVSADVFAKPAAAYAGIAQRAASLALQYHDEKQRTDLVADLYSADAQASAAIKSAPVSVQRLTLLPPVAQPASDAAMIPGSVSTAGIGTTKGLMIAGGAGLLLWALMRRKKKGARR